MAPQQGWLKALRTPRGLSFACLALGFISLVWVLLVGVGSLTSACNSEDELSEAERTAMFTASGIWVPATDPGNCARITQWWWFLVCFQFVAVALGVAAATGTYEGSLKPGAMVLLVIVTTLLLSATRTFLDLHYQLNESTSTAHRYIIAANFSFVGGVLCCLFNSLSCVALGWRPECAGSKAAAVVD